jgi:hypothetical protein
LSTLIDLRDCDVTCGGCILTAAELESSKTYVPVSGGSWNIMHALPVAEEIFSQSSICLREQLHPGSEPTLEELAGPNCRIYRTSGPIRTEKFSNPRIKKEYNWGPVFGIFRRKPPQHFLPGWPKLTLVEVPKDESGSQYEVIKVSLYFC